MVTPQYQQTRRGSCGSTGGQSPAIGIGISLLQVPCAETTFPRGWMTLRYSWVPAVITGNMARTSSWHSSVWSIPWAFGINAIHRIDRCRHGVGWQPGYWAWATDALWEVWGETWHAEAVTGLWRGGHRRPSLYKENLWGSLVERKLDFLRS